jgi:MFS family permease
MIFTVAFFSLSIGGVFGALFVKAGTKGPMILAIALILAVAVLLVILAPQLGAIFRSLTFVRVGAGFLAIGVAAAVGQYLGLRSASVR